MIDGERPRDAFCAVALLLGFPADELAAALGGEVPAWVHRYRAAPDSRGRAAQLAPRLLAVRLAAEQGRVRWG